MGFACARISACGVGLAATVMVPLLSTACAVSVDAVSVEAVSGSGGFGLGCAGGERQAQYESQSQRNDFFELFHEIYSFDSEKKFHFMEGI